MIFRFVLFVRRYFFLEFSKQVQRLMMVDFSKALTTQELSVIIKNEIPLLEYDDASPEVISANHEWTAGQLPEKCLFAFLGDVVHDYAVEHGAEVVETIVTVSRDIKVYVFRFIWRENLFSSIPYWICFIHTGNGHTGYLWL